MQAKTWKEWEAPLLELEEGIAKLKVLAAKEQDEDRREEFIAKISEYEDGIERYIKTMYRNLSPWEKVLVARSERRPYTLDYVSAIFTEFTELSGDRHYGNDEAIIGGPAFLDGEPVMVIGHQKGRNIQERQRRNFAMSKPEGYRKAMRLMDMASRFGMPVISFIDTPAADPGVEAESRGISEAIASSMLRMFELKVPVVCAIIGEGGSGGAIGIAVGNTVMMQEHAIYSVIPPEGCAAILWRMPEKGPEAADALQLTAQSALKFKLIDEIVKEPKGGAHRDAIEAAALVKTSLKKNLSLLAKLGPEEVKEHRSRKFREIGMLG